MRLKTKVQMVTDFRVLSPHPKDEKEVFDLPSVYRMSQEERSVFWAVTVSAILSGVYVHVSYSERFPR
jgi:hypothetical protein